ncbi:GlxA-like beta barrel domain-containing protein OS=Streptomyces antimycoticus OX=68175 GN=SSPO_062000 PE=4 SV=1 [Streptomyces antimycoticus]
MLAVSGLDEIGQVVPGKNEIYDPKTKKWKYLPKKRFFPTYPALFLTGKGQIFYTGSNAGYGPDDKGRTPGIWDLKSNRFDVVPGISDPDALETSMSVLLPPAQDQRYMVLGRSARTPRPRRRPGSPICVPISRASGTGRSCMRRRAIRAV